MRIDELDKLLLLFISNYLLILTYVRILCFVWIISNFNVFIQRKAYNYTAFFFFLIILNFHFAVIGEEILSVSLSNAACLGFSS